MDQTNVSNEIVAAFIDLAAFVDLPAMLSFCR
jgi:hypothetical protein